MKHFFAAFCAALTAAACLAVPVGAVPEAEAALPFTLTAPEHVKVTYLDGRDSLNTCEVAYSQSAEMSAFAAAFETDYDKAQADLLEKGFDSVSITAQIDWSLDTQDDWHANDYWLTDGYDEDYRQHLGAWAYLSETHSSAVSNSAWIFRGMGNIDDPEDPFWYNNQEGVGATGWSTVLKEGQYDAAETEDGHTAKIDFTRHTLYTRVRWLVNSHRFEADENKVTVSDWSAVASVGKDAEKAEFIKPGDVAAPQISNLHYTGGEFNGQPIIAFTLTVDEKLTNQLTQASGTQGSIWLETEARKQGTDEWYGLQGDWTVKTGEMEIKLVGLAEQYGGRIEDGTPLELRARYGISQAEQEDFYTDYSDVLTFGAADLTTAPPVSAAESTSATPYQEAPPTNGGLWLILLLLLLLIIIIIIAVVILRSKKQKKG